MAPGQRRLKLNEKQTAAMIKLAAQKPWDRQARIQDYVNKISGLLTASTPKEFSLTVSPKMMEVSVYASTRLYCLWLWDCEAVMEARSSTGL